MKRTSVRFCWVWNRIDWLPKPSTPVLTQSCKAQHVYNCLKLVLVVCDNICVCLCDVCRIWIFVEPDAQESQSICDLINMQVLFRVKRSATLSLRSVALFHRTSIPSSVSSWAVPHLALDLSNRSDVLCPLARSWLQRVVVRAYEAQASYKSTTTLSTDETARISAGKDANCCSHTTASAAPAASHWSSFPVIIICESQRLRDKHRSAAKDSSLEYTHNRII